MIRPRTMKRVIGWREWVALPELGIDRIKPKIDTGARSASLHASEVVRYSRRGKDFVRFRVHPLQRDARMAVEARAEVIAYRRIRSSSGHAEVRPVIRTELELMGERWPIELTLANRIEMGFRMLLGREALSGRFLVDPSRSFCAGREPVRSARSPSKSRLP